LLARKQRFPANAACKKILKAKIWKKRSLLVLLILLRHQLAVEFKVGQSHTLPANEISRHHSIIGTRARLDDQGTLVGVDHADGLRRNRVLVGRANTLFQPVAIFVANLAFFKQVTVLVDGILEGSAFLDKHVLDLIQAVHRVLQGLAVVAADGLVKGDLLVRSREFVNKIGGKRTVVGHGKLESDMVSTVCKSGRLEI
jgi:hypothetical protein